MRFRPPNANGHRPRRDADTALSVALAGLTALGVAIGIGRFAFTPMLPMMLAERSVNLIEASYLASSNYLGYLVGAIACTLQPWLMKRAGWSLSASSPPLIKIGLAATVLLTAAMSQGDVRLWAVLRFGAGVASAIVFVYTSSFSLEVAAKRGRPALGALIYIGPGLGIAASGLVASALTQLHSSATTGWVTFSALAAAFSALVWRVLTPPYEQRPDLPLPSDTRAAQPLVNGDRPKVTRAEITLVSIAYGLAGVGYIISATFLPVIAHEEMPGSAWLAFFWPLFGVAVMIGAFAVSRLSAGRHGRLRLASCYLIQAGAIAITLCAPSDTGFALGSFLLGLPFTAITFFTMQEARRMRPATATSLMGVLTVAYGLGQIIGPPFAALVVARSASASSGFHVALWTVDALLVVGAALYIAINRHYPTED